MKTNHKLKNLSKNTEFSILLKIYLAVFSLNTPNTVNKSYISQVLVSIFILIIKKLRHTPNFCPFCSK